MSRVRTYQKYQNNGARSTRDPFKIQINNRGDILRGGQNKIRIHIVKLVGRLPAEEPSTFTNNLYLRGSTKRENNWITMLCQALVLNCICNHWTIWQCYIGTEPRLESRTSDRKHVHFHNGPPHDTITVFSNLNYNSNLNYIDRDFCSRWDGYKLDSVISYPTNYWTTKI